jgi:BMFP domain-containing protein YqiC
MTDEEHIGVNHPDAPTMTTTVADVLAEIRRQLDWEGPTGSKMGHIVITRDQAEYLHEWALKLIHAKDELETKINELEARINQLEAEVRSTLGEIHALAEIKTAGDHGKGSMSERLERIWQLSK